MTRVFFRVKTIRGTYKGRGAYIYCFMCIHPGTWYLSGYPSATGVIQTLSPGLDEMGMLSVQISVSEYEGFLSVSIIKRGILPTDL